MLTKQSHRKCYKRKLESTNADYKNDYYGPQEKVIFSEASVCPQGEGSASGGGSASGRGPAFRGVCPTP